jgi:hypothetical protein
MAGCRVVRRGPCPRRTGPRGDPGTRRLPNRPCRLLPSSGASARRCNPRKACARARFEVLSGSRRAIRQERISDPSRLFPDSGTGAPTHHLRWRLRPLEWPLSGQRYRFRIPYERADFHAARCGVDPVLNLRIRDGAPTAPLFMSNVCIRPSPDLDCTEYQCL